MEGVSFVAETGSGHSVMVDGAPEQGGRNLGIRPMELVLAGAAACTAFDVMVILRKGRQPVADCVVEAEAKRAGTDPKVFTHIHLRYAIALDGGVPVEMDLTPSPTARKAAGAGDGPSDSGWAENVLRNSAIAKIPLADQSQTRAPA